MKMLEARFHPPPAERRNYVVVGHVIIQPDGQGMITRVKPACSLGRHRAPATMLATLRHLTRLAAPHPWEGLQALQSAYWTFVPVEPVTFISPSSDAERDFD